MQNKLLDKFSHPTKLLPIKGEKIAMTYLALSKDYEQTRKYFPVGNEKKCQIILGPSGIGKTHALFSRVDHGKILLYFTCRISDEIMVDTALQPLDRSFQTFIDKMLSKLKAGKENVQRNTEIARNGLACLILARAIYIKILLEKFTNISTTELVLAQLNGQTLQISNIFTDLYKNLFSASSDEILNVITDILSETRRNIEFAVDEAYVLQQWNTDIRFKSTSGKHRSMLTVIGTIFKELSKMFKELEANTFIAGTGLSLSDSSVLESSLGISSFEGKIPQYYKWNNSVQEVWEYLGILIDLTGCHLEKHKESLYWLIGRFRPTAFIPIYISEFYQEGNAQKCKDEIIAWAIERSRQSMKRTLLTRLTEEYKKRENEDSKLKLNQLIKGIEFILLTYYLPLNDRQVWIEEDLMDIGITVAVYYVKKEADNVEGYYSLNEPWVVDVCHEFLKDKQDKVSPVFHFFLKQVQQIIAIYNESTTLKGLPFERLCLSGFMVMKNNQITWGNIPLISLNPTLVNSEMFTILKCTPYFCDKMATFKDLDCQTDIEALETVVRSNTNSSLLLNPKNAMGPDAILIQKTFYNNGNNSRLILVLFFFAIYTDEVSAKKSEKNKRTCNPCYIYSIEKKPEQGVIQLDKQYEQEYKDFHALFGNKLLHMRNITKDGPSNSTRSEEEKRAKQLKNVDYDLIVIRVQVDFPNSNSLGECKVEGNQIYLYIDNKNINTLINDENAVEFLRRITSPETSKKRSFDQVEVRDDILEKKMQKTLDEMNDD